MAMEASQEKPEEFRTEVNLCGLVCPMPVLRLKKLLQKAAPLEVVTVLTDDPHAVADIRTFAQQSGHTVLSQVEVEGGVVRHQVRHRA